MSLSRCQRGLSHTLGLTNVTRAYIAELMTQRLSLSWRPLGAAGRGDHIHRAEAASQAIWSGGCTSGRRWGLALLMRPTSAAPACRSLIAALLTPERLRQQSLRHTCPVETSAPPFRVDAFNIGPSCERSSVVLTHRLMKTNTLTPDLPYFSTRTSSRRHRCAQI